MKIRAPFKAVPFIITCGTMIIGAPVVLFLSIFLSMRPTEMMAISYSSGAMMLLIGGFAIAACGHVILGLLMVAYQIASFASMLYELR